MELINKRIKIVIAAALIIVAAYFCLVTVYENTNMLSDIPNRDIVNINTADVSELLKLYGIGEATAQKIIDYRNENGDFEKLEDVIKVNGIGESFIENNKKNIVF